MKIQQTTALNISLAQLNFLLGDIEGNAAKIIKVAHEARTQQHSDIIIFPELAITGYPPEDLLLRQECLRRVETALTHIQESVQDIYCVIGHPWQENDRLYNCATVLFNQKIIGRYYKQYLPNYGVFDEKRYFTAGNKACVCDIKGLLMGITICEDLWKPGPLEQAKKSGAQAMICINASPFHAMKTQQREQNLRERQTEEGKLPIVYVNLIGGQDELVFDGNSFIMDANGIIIQHLKPYKEQVKTYRVDISQSNNPSKSLSSSEEESIYGALKLGTHDYIIKNHFSGALLGLSGGIDSALTLAIAADAIGPENCHAVMMPTRYTSQMSLDDAKQVAANLGVKYSVIPVEECFISILDTLTSSFVGTNEDITEQNIQARIRGLILMALSNKFGKIVLNTGNKSEMAVGYATLYGDMVGGFAVLKDVTKSMVYRLVHYRNTVAPVVPTRIIDRPPSAELAHGQLDQDTLPDYAIIDRIIAMYIEQNRSINAIAATGIDYDVVEHIVGLIYRSEYKRRQAPPGVRISQRAFGRDWRYPITSGYEKRIE